MKFSAFFLLFQAGFIQAFSTQESSQIGSRIIGGTAASSGQFPFVAYLEIQTKSGKYHCAGGLLNNQWIVTSGYCVYMGESITIQLGSIYLTQNDPNRQTLTTANYLIHPQYSPATLENDIALVEFRLPIVENEYIQPISILTTMDVVDYQAVKALGWGQTSQTSTTQSEILLHTDLAILPQSDCIKVYGNQIKESMVCAAANSNEGICHGDMGGPLIERIGNYYRLVGVASFLSGAGCENLHPSGFTRVFRYASWINQTIGGIL